MTPQIALKYSSAGGPSLYGYGWDLPIGRIQRRLKHGLLNCADLREKNEFVLILPGQAIEFVLDEATHAGLAHTEEAFFRIEYLPYPSTATTPWMVWASDGRRYEFGTGAAARTGSELGDIIHSASCTDPTALFDIAYTFSWELTRVTDPNGDSIEIEYLNEGNVARPNTVRYGGNSNMSFGHPFEVQFVWANRPPGDAITTGMGGVLSRLQHRLSKIKVLYAGSVVRSYALTYDGSGPDDPLREGRQSFLTAVTQYAGDVDTPQGAALARVDGSPAATTLAYHENRSETADFGLASNFQVTVQPAESVMVSPTFARWYTNDAEGHTLRDILDINGDGFPDWVDTSPLNGGSLGSCGTGQGYWNVYFGSKAGFSSEPTPWQVPDRSLMCVIQFERLLGAQRFTDRITVDLDGDGFADFVDATSGTWQVYLGHGGIYGFNPIPTPWPGVGPSVRRRVGGINHFGYQNGIADTRGLLDINGDGLPDLVDTVDSHYWQVFINAGYGFAAAKGFQAPWGDLHYSAQGLPILKTIDINGDGLPDQAVASPDRWDVYLNNGGGIGPVEPWLLTRTSSAHWWFQVVDADNDTMRDFFDINGDGLPDIVDAFGCSDQNPKWEVVLNRGSGFSDQVLQWQVPSRAYCRIVQRGAAETNAETLDIDNDGLVDYVDFRSTAPAVILTARNAGGAWCVSDDEQRCVATDDAKVAPRPEGVRADLLVQMVNGLGGTTSLEYRPLAQWPGGRVPFNLWTLTRIESDDGLCADPEHLLDCASGGFHTIEKSFTYANPEFESWKREFLGFRDVWIYDIDPATRTALMSQGFTVGPSRVTKLRFEYLGARKGKIQSAVEYDTEPLVSQQRRVALYSWGCADPDTGSTAECDGDRVWVRLHQTRSIEFDVGGASQRETLTVNEGWSQCPDGRYNGQVAHSWTGDASDATVRAHTHTEHTCVNTDTAYYVKPSHSWVTDSSDADPPLQEQWFFYDGNQGNLIRTETWLDQPTASTPPACTSTPRAATLSTACVRTAYGYGDGYGNVTAVIDSNDRRTETTYDPEVHIYPYEVVTPKSEPASSLERKVATKYDAVCGTALWRTVLYTGSQDPASALVPKSRWKYDDFCRLIATALADQNVDGGTLDADGPRQKFGYYLGWQRGATSIWTRTREPNYPDGMTMQTALADALGRVIQTQRQMVVDGALRTVALTTDYDLRGNVQTEYVPFFISSPLYVAPPAGTGKTTREYEALGRLSKVTNPDAHSYREIGHTIPWQTTTKDECYTQPAPGCPGGQVVTKRDALGRTVEKQAYEGDTLELRTRYAYDELGRLRSTQQGDPFAWNASTEIRIEYDSLGRKIFMHDPDSGDWRYGYDNVGNLIYEEDPKPGQHLRFCYDRLSRPIRKCTSTATSYTAATACDAACTDDVFYTYDDATVPYGLGQLTGVTDLSGTTLFQEYDVRGRLRSATKSIAASGTINSATTSYTYDMADHVSTITYPDRKVVTYGYDTVGQVENLAGPSATYLTNLTYDVFGRTKQLTHGNGVTDALDYWGSEANFRVKQILTTAPGGTWQNLNYVTAGGQPGYQKNGLLTQLTDNGPGAALSNTATFTYDGLGRLTGASGPNLPYAAAADCSNGYCYDPWGNMTHKEGSTLMYDTAQPHTLTAVNNDPTGIDHDENGNRTGKLGQTYEPTADDRVKTITANGQTVQFLYDFTGRRVAKVVDGGLSVTRYYSGLAEVTDGWLTKYYVAAGRVIASQRVRDFQLVAAPAAEPLVQLVAARGLQPMLVVALRTDVGRAAAGATTILALALLVAPWRRKRVVGLAVRPGHVVLVLLTFSVTALPLPILVQPAAAQILQRAPTATPPSAGTAPPTATLTPTATPPPTRTAVPTATPVPSDPRPFGLSADAVEIVSKRTLTAKHFRRADGSFVAVIGAHPLHYHAPDGSLQDIDLTFHARGTEQVVDGIDAFRVRLPESGTDIEITDAAGSGVRWLLPLPPVTLGNRAKYADAQGLHWTYTTTRRGLKQTATISAPRGPHTYAFSYALVGNQPDFTIDAEGNAVAGTLRVPRAVIHRADGVVERAGPWHLAGGSRLEFALDDSAWPAAAFPYVIDPTTDIYAATTDGRITGQSPVYATARSTSAVFSSSLGTVTVGQYLSIGSYFIHRSFFEFDTSSVAASQAVTQVNVSLRLSSDVSTAAEFDHQIVKYDWSSPLSAANQEANYDGCLAPSGPGEGLDAVLCNSASCATAGTRYTSPNLTTGWVKKGAGAWTRYCLRSSRDASNQAPTGYEHANWVSADATGTADDPYLRVVYVDPTPTPTPAGATPTPSLSACAQYLSALGPAYWYRLDETTGPTAVDRTGALNCTYSKSRSS